MNDSMKLFWEWFIFSKSFFGLKNHYATYDQTFVLLCLFLDLCEFVLLMLNQILRVLQLFLDFVEFLAELCDFCVFLLEKLVEIFVGVL